MALFRKKDAAKRHHPQDAHRLAIAQAKISYDFHQDKQLAYWTYRDLIESEALRPLAMHAVIKDITG